ncbi:T9SS type A sorting domain-containing protein [bacterium]|nr:T9SS type A sorting domain-containing protein [bacterium]
MVVGVEDARPGLQVRAAPNPFTGQTAFRFTLPTRQPVELAVFDLAGRRVATLARGTLAAGRHGVTWDGQDDGGRPQPSGVYVYRLRSPGQVVVERITLVR